MVKSFAPRDWSTTNQQKSTFIYKFVYSRLHVLSAIRNVQWMLVRGIAIDERDIVQHRDMDIERIIEEKTQSV